VGKYDVAVEAGPSFTTRREEAATQMFELIRAYPQAAPGHRRPPGGEPGLVGADKIAERLRSLLPPALREGGEGALPAQVQQQMAEGVKVIQQQQGRLQQLQAELQEAANNRGLKEAELRIRAEEVAVKRIEAEARLLDAQTKARAPIFPAARPRARSRGEVGGGELHV
jgi:hypothetical protein